MRITSDFSTSITDFPVAPTLVATTMGLGLLCFAMTCTKRCVSLWHWTVEQIYPSYLSQARKLKLREEFKANLSIDISKIPFAEERSYYNTDRKFHRHGIRTYKATRVQVSNVNRPIDANWIDPSNLKNLIITDAPLRREYHSFWQTVQHVAETSDSSVISIVMIGHEEEEGSLWDKYWPSPGSAFTGQNFLIKNCSENQQDFLLERKIALQSQGKKAVSVKHYQFHTWKDGTSNAAIESVGDLCLRLVESKMPVIIHCSAGINRSGVVATCYIALRKIIQEYNRDISKAPPDFVPQIIRNLRDKSIGRSPRMLGSCEHYIVVHEILEYVLKKL